MGTGRREDPSETEKIEREKLEETELQEPQPGPPSGTLKTRVTRREDK